MLILEHQSPLSNGVKPNGVKPVQLSDCYNCNYNYNNNNIKVITIDLDITTLILVFHLYNPIYC